MTPLIMWLLWKCKEILTHKRPLGGTTIGAASVFTVVVAILILYHQDCAAVEISQEQRIIGHRLRDQSLSSQICEPDNSMASSNVNFSSICKEGSDNVSKKGQLLFLFLQFRKDDLVERLQTSPQSICTAPA